jgi:predicted O-methyltransferase YrrM
MTVDEAVNAAMGVTGFMQPHELHWLATNASTRKAVVEFGSWKGRSTKAIALACPGTVYAVDHWKGSESELSTNQAEAVRLGADGLYDLFRLNLRDEIRSGKVIPIRAESKSATLFLSAEKGYGWADMLFIDGDHMYESVKRDIQLWMPFVAHGGLLCGHDYYDAPGVMQAVRELIPNHVEGSIWSYIVP